MHASLDRDLGPELSAANMRVFTVVSPFPTAEIQEVYVPSERLHEHDSPAPSIQEQRLPVLCTNAGLHCLSVLAALIPQQPRVLLGRHVLWGMEGRTASHLLTVFVAIDYRHLHLAVLTKLWSIKRKSRSTSQYKKGGWKGGSKKKNFSPWWLKMRPSLCWGLSVDRMERWHHTSELISS